nr:hypothetical protein [Tanacetum cinerariifolium]
MFVLLDDQMNSVINWLTAKSTLDDLILYHKGLSDVKESMIIDLKLCYNTYKFKKGETLTQTFTRYKALMNELDFQHNLEDEEDTRSSQEYLNDLEEEYQEIALLATSKIFFKKGSQRFSSTKATDDTICHKYGRKVKAKLALLGSGTLAKSSMVKNKGLVAEAYECDEEYVSFDENEMTEVKVLMALADDESVDVGQESVRNREWVNITMKNVHTLLDMKDNDEMKSFLDYWILPTESHVNITDPSVAIIDSSATEYDSADESSVCITHLPLLEKLANVEPHLKSQDGSSSRSKTSRPSPCIHLGFNDHLSYDFINYPICDICGSYDHDTHAFRFFNTIRQQTEETNHITFNESTDAIKFIKPLDENIIIVESEQYPHDEYLHPCEPFQRYQVNRNVVSLIEPYERPEPAIIETNGSSYQNDHSAQDDDVTPRQWQKLRSAT